MNATEEELQIRVLPMSWTVANYAFFALPAAIWFANRLFFRNRIHWLLLWPIAVVSCYSALLIGVHLLDSHLEAELYKHDLDGDRSFSGIEDTPAMLEAMGRLTNDTGRALAPITGVPFSLIWVAMNYIPLGLISLAIWRFRSHRGDFDLTIDRNDIVNLETETGYNSENPYDPPHFNRSGQ